jgi:hypothetical protein
MSNCPIDLKFSKINSNKRLEKAYESLGVKIVTRIIGFTLFLLGAKREDIAQYLQIPMGTFLSFLTRTDQYGILAFEDRRKSAYKKVVKIEAPVKVSLAVTEQNVIIQLGGNNQVIIIPRKNLLQSKPLTRYLLATVLSILSSLMTIQSLLKKSKK